MYSHRPYRSTTVSSNNTHVLKNVTTTAALTIPGTVPGAGSGTRDTSVSNRWLSGCGLYRHLAAVIAVSCSIGLAAEALPQSPAAGGAHVDEIRAAAARMPRLHSLIVSRGGEIAVEYYAKGAGPSRAANVKSVSKSVISTLVGIALERG